MADLVWSDPDPDKDEFAISPRLLINYCKSKSSSFYLNFSYSNVCLLTILRGAGYTFGGLVVKKFLEINNMEHILRAHQLCMEGYQVISLTISNYVCNFFKFH